MKEKILLIDPPAFPKGTVSLSLFIIGNSLKKDFDVKYLDLNFKEDQIFFSANGLGTFKMIGLKVSAQNFSKARELTTQIKKNYSHVKVVWGGELATLLPEICLQHADSIVSGLFEPVAEEFLQDLKNGQLKRSYSGKNEPDAGIFSPDFSLIKDFSKYNRFMGLPLETSRGCSETCTFCMVLTMQRKHYHLKEIDQLKNELLAYSGHFINIVDYNFGVSLQHVINVCNAIENSGALGWMAEMNIEMLDNDVMLQAMKKSRCRMIYCGLESIDETALDSVNKARTNNVANYERIIKKVQSYGINIAAGLIIGLDGADAATYYRTIDFFERMGIIYTKFTFLTFNPGTRVKNYMSKRGSFITEEIDKYDGNCITYLPSGMSETELYNITNNLIKRFYPVSAILKRSLKTGGSFLAKAEFFLFNVCYSRAYDLWLSHDVFNKPTNFKDLLNSGYYKSASFAWAEKLLHFVRKIRRWNDR